MKNVTFCGFLCKQTWLRNLNCLITTLKHRRPIKLKLSLRFANSNDVCQRCRTFVNILHLVASTKGKGTGPYRDFAGSGREFCSALSMKHPDAQLRLHICMLNNAQNEVNIVHYRQPPIVSICRYSWMREKNCRKSTQLRLRAKMCNRNYPLFPFITAFSTCTNASLSMKLFYTVLSTLTFSSQFYH